MEDHLQNLKFLMFYSEKVPKGKGEKIIASFEKVLKFNAKTVEAYNKVTAYLLHKGSTTLF